MESQKKFKSKFSFEFFPPKTPEAVNRLQEAQQRLAKLRPDFFSVTFGAGGSTRDRTFDTIQDIREKTGIDAAPHISCMGHFENEIREMLELYRASGINHLVVIRGDLPSGSAGGHGQFRYANELVAFIREVTGDHFHIDVASYPEFHPQAPAASVDLVNFKRKVDAGADSVITQYFFNPYAYYRFIESCEKMGIDIPIVPGIMPITNSTQLIRFSEACGAEIPRWILKRLQEFGDDRASIRSFGIDIATELCKDLLANGAPGFHVFTMNRAAASEAIWENLGLLDHDGNRQQNLSTG